MFRTLDTSRVYPAQLTKALTAPQSSSPQPERDGDPSAPATLDFVRLPLVIDLTAGSAELRLGLIDGPVEMSHPDIVTENIQMVNSGSGPRLVDPDDTTLIHRTFVAGILLSRRGTSAPAICPGCSLLTRYIFDENDNMLVSHVR